MEGRSKEDLQLGSQSWNNKAALQAPDRKTQRFLSRSVEVMERPYDLGVSIVNGVVPSKRWNGLRIQGRKSTRAG
jgi:hypothetical protein